jgi:hypothetical protein
MVADGTPVPADVISKLRHLEVEPEGKHCRNYVDHMQNMSMSAYSVHAVPDFLLRTCIPFFQNIRHQHSCSCNTNNLPELTKFAFIPEKTTTTLKMKARTKLPSTILHFLAY